MARLISSWAAALLKSRHCLRRPGMLCRPYGLCRVSHPLVLVFVGELTTWVPHPLRRGGRRMGHPLVGSPQQKPNVL